MPFTDLKNSKLIQFYCNFYLKPGFGPVFWTENSPQDPLYWLWVLVCCLQWLLDGFYSLIFFADRKNSKFIQFYDNLYLKPVFGPIFWPGITHPRPVILIVSIGMSFVMIPVGLLAIFTFYRSKKDQIVLILCLFIAY